MVCSAVRKTLLSVSTVPLGVRAGTKMPNHSANSSAGYPASATVGTSGSSGLPQASLALSLALHPPRGHLQSPPHSCRPQRRHLQVQGLSDRWTRPLQDDDAGDRRVHPSLPDPLPKRFHRIRHYGLLASSNRAANIARARELLATPPPSKEPQPSAPTATDEQRVLPCPCPCCGGRMIIIETFARGCQPKHRTTPTTNEIRIDTS